MIVIAQPYTNFQESLSESSLELAARKLLQLGELRAKKFYMERLPKGVISVEADIELGSTRTWIAVSTLATVLISYGGIRQSIDYLIKDAKDVGDLILPDVNSAIGLNAQPTVKQRRLGTPGQLHRLFEAVRRHEISPEEATDRAMAIFDSYEKENAVVENRRMIIGQLDREFKQTHRNGHFNPRPRPIPAPPPEMPTVHRPRKGVRVTRGPDGEIIYLRNEQ